MNIRRLWRVTAATLVIACVTTVSLAGSGYNEVTLFPNGIIALRAVDRMVPF